MKQFKTESKRMLDLMINSIYTNREIFIRELLSNASDAIDKLYYKSLNGGVTGVLREDFYIKIELDKVNRIITITDNGIGMNVDELEKNLGTIAKSGSFDFKNENQNDDEVSIIGQFGVGFYSAFMVAQKVEVISKAFGSLDAHIWSSKGAEGYKIEPCEKQENGTIIKLYLKPDSEEKYDEFLQEYRIRQLVKKYSDYIKYPIKMLVTKYKTEGEGEEQKTVPYQEEEVLNSMIPIWRKQKSEVSDEQYEEFYKDKFHDYVAPIKIISSSVEGAIDYKALLFIPKNAPMNYYTKNYEKGLMLFTNGVLITEKCADLLPDYFGFVKGVVDSQLTLNISRETVQQNRQLKAIRQSLEKKIKNELISMQQNEREKYNEFFNNFGVSIKYGIYSSYGANSEMLKDLLMFKSAKTGEYVTLKEYVLSAGEADSIIYATGKSVDAIKSMPQTEILLDKGKDVLCFTGEIDEFCAKMLQKYDEKEFKSIETAIESEVEQVELDSEISKRIMECLEGKIVKVKGTNALKNYAVALSSEGEISIEMEKVFAQIPGGDGATAQKVLEINVNHAVYEKLKQIEDNDEFKKFVSILYQQARLIQGLGVDDALALSEDIFSLITK